MQRREQPILIKQVPRGHAVAYDVEQKERVGDDGRREQYYEYKEVIVRRLEPEAIVNAMVAAEFGEKEMGIIVDRLEVGATKQWDEYMAYREKCKRYVHDDLKMGEAGTKEESIKE